MKTLRQWLPLIFLATAFCGKARTQPGSDGPTSRPEAADTIVKVFGFDGQRRYAYCPSVIRDGDLRHLWFCGNEPEGQFSDHIYYLAPGASAPKMVLAPGAPGTWDGRHVCDPSVVAGEFKYAGETYQYAMLYLGNRTDRYFNEIGVAFAHSLSADKWVKYPQQLVKKTWEGDNDLTLSNDGGKAKLAWGVGQPSAVSLDGKGRLLLSYTIGDQDGGRLVAREADLSDMGSPTLGPVVKVSNTVNGDIAFDEDRKYIYMIGHAGGVVTDYPAYIPAAVELYRIPYGDFLAGRGQWRQLVRLDPAVTGFPRNHNACIARDAYGMVERPEYPELYFTISKASPEVAPAPNTHAEWTYHIYKYQRLRVPVIVITDLYHPYQDPGDNLDLLMGFALPGIDLKAIILDITDNFRKDTADHPFLWHDPRGPREAGVIPVTQLNYIFHRQVPFAIGPLSMLRSEREIPPDEGGVELFLNTLRGSERPVDVLSFGSARVLAVAFNKAPDVMRKKIRLIHLSAGTASHGFKLGHDAGANAIPGGEWNVALDVFAFTGLLRSGLPIALYPCAGVDGAFVKDPNNTYWRLPDVSFVRRMDARLQRYLGFAFRKVLRFDFLRAMDRDDPGLAVPDTLFKPFHIWETALWTQAAGLRWKGVVERLMPCTIDLHDDGRFDFKYTDKPTPFSIYYRADPVSYEKVLQRALPGFYKELKAPRL
ncbi:MAG: hypothetical protein J0H74_25600 [Chitinophagaceae bacterium]|nr:hypothetical protein [Chitinophagaceae bacterium]